MNNSFINLKTKQSIPAQISRYFNLIAFIVFSALFLDILIFSYSGKNSKNKLPIILTFLLVFLVMFLLLKAAKKISTFSNIKINLVLIVVIVLIGVLQIYIGRILHMKPVTDLRAIDTFANAFAKEGTFANIYDAYQPSAINYMARYPNNNAILMLLGFYYRAIYLTLGYIPKLSGVILNTIAINLSIILSILIAKKTKGNYMALFVAFLSFFFLPYYTYTPYFYTDSLSVPFGVLAIYLFIFAIKSKKRISSFIYMFFVGATLLVGFRLKGSLIVVFVAIIIYAFMKFNIKSAFKLFGSMLVGFLLLFVIYNGVLNSCNITSNEIKFKEEYPLEHWVMMGLYGNGSYHDPDSAFTRSHPNTEIKKQEAKRVIKERLNDYGPVGLVDHLRTKARFTWDDGTYFISNHIYEPYKVSPIHSYLIKGSENYSSFYIYSNGFQLFLLLCIALSFFFGIKKPKVDIMLLLKIILWGIFLFFLMWETRSRYLYNCLPIVLLIASDGLDSFQNVFEKKNKPTESTKTKTKLSI